MSEVVCKNTLIELLPIANQFIWLHFFFINGQWSLLDWSRWKHSLLSQSKNFKNFSKPETSIQMLNHCIFRTTPQLLFCARLQISNYLLKRVSLVHMDMSWELITLLMCIMKRSCMETRKYRLTGSNFWSVSTKQKTEGTVVLHIASPCLFY